MYPYTSGQRPGPEVLILARRALQYRSSDAHWSTSIHDYAVRATHRGFVSNYSISPDSAIAIDDKSATHYILSNGTAWRSD